MTPSHTAPVRGAFGTWKSPISAARIGRDVVHIKELAVGAAGVYWIESRPARRGRNVVVAWDPTRGVRDVLPEPYDASTTVHEYGGGAITIAGDEVVFSNAVDQRLYRVRDGARPEPLTDGEPWRFADGRFDARHNRLIIVRERHDPGEAPINEIVAVDLSAEASPRTLLTGADFYSTPRISPDGNCIAWSTWNRPSMPWIGTELWVAEFAPDGSLTSPVKVAGGPGESIFQPEWSPGGVLHFVSDRTGWWNLYRRKGDTVEPLVAREAEFGQPQWEFGLSTYAFISDHRIVCGYATAGVWRLAVLDCDARVMTDLPLPYTDVTHVSSYGSKAVVIAAGPRQPFSVVLFDADTCVPEVLARSFDALDWQPYFSTAERLEYPSNGRTAHAFFFPPANPDFEGLPNERPPLIVRCHGGPAYAASPALDARVQYWTSIGFAVMLVNYAGSSNFGRAYRQILEGQWGRLDLEDVVAAVGFVGERGLADSRRVAIAGQSAGGYLVLCALAWTDVFHAGASYYGAVDLALLHSRTHKFESHYIERLVGAPAEDVDAYRRRSPLGELETATAPLILFHGADDPIAPPDQLLRTMRAVVDRPAPSVAFVMSGERHGFDDGENIRRALEAELLLYAIAFLKEPLRW